MVHNNNYNEDKPLTAKQERFCQEYVIDWNGTRAAIAAGYSKKTAYSIAGENLKKPELADYIKEIQSDLQKQANISALSQLEYLKSYIASEETSNREKLDAIKEINKMLGFYANEKQEVNLNSIVPIFPNIK